MYEALQREVREGLRLHGMSVGYCGAVMTDRDDATEKWWVWMMS
jgi:hypothetical protein